MNEENPTQGDAWIDQIRKTYENWSLDRLRDRFNQVRRVTEHLVDLWNRPNLTGTVVLQWDPNLVPIAYSKLKHPPLDFFVLNINTVPDNDELREFIHNLCTNLCAEKLILQELINQARALS